MNLRIYIYILLDIFLLLHASVAGGPNGAETMIVSCLDPSYSGNVTSVTSGDTIIVDGLVLVAMADVKSPEMNTKEGISAKIYTENYLKNKIVYLDYFNESGQISAVVFLSHANGTLNKSAIFNRMLVDTGNAEFCSSDESLYTWPSHEYWYTEWPYCEEKSFAVTV